MGLSEALPVGKVARYLGASVLPQGAAFPPFWENIIESRCKYWETRQLWSAEMVTVDFLGEHQILFTMSIQKIKSVKTIAK